MNTLGEAMQGRRNHFHLLRMVAATLVLVSHSYAIALGDPMREPLRVALGVTPGSIAVDVFFLISGLLVTQSLDRRADLWAFARARCLRILPGLAVALGLTVLVLGAGLSSLALHEFLGDRQTWRFLLANLTLFVRIEYTLPGLFLDNPMRGTVNGSLWSLKSEVWSYAGLAGLWCGATVMARGPMPRAAILRWMVTGVALALLLAHAWAATQADIEQSRCRVYAMFALGSALYLWRHQLPWQRHLGGWALALLVVAACFGKPAFALAYLAGLPLAVLGLAYGAPGPLLAYNRCGDFSYGLYIYAFPVQQAVAALWPGCSVWALGVTSWGLTMVLAVASWHLVEHPAMRWGARRWARASAAPAPG